MGQHGSSTLWRLALVAVLGGLGLAACDQMHAQAEVLSHQAGGPFGQAWWVAPMFALASVAIALGARPFAQRRADPTAAGFAFAAVAFVAAYGGSAVFGTDHPYMLALVLFVLWLPRLARDPDRPRLIAFAPLLAAAGVATELIISATGAFEYAGDDATVIPWLAGVYLHGAPLALIVSRWALGAGAAERA